MSVKRTYVRHEIVLVNSVLGREEVLYTGPSRTALALYEIIRNAFILMDISSDAYVLSVRLCL